MAVTPSIDSLSGFAYWRASLSATASSWREMLSPGGALKNVGAGLTTALVAIPLNLALALACGLPPGIGLVTGALAGIVGALFGGARLQVTGPEVALAPIGLEIVSRYGLDGLVVATFLAGLMQIAFGVLRIGRLTRAIPVPVVVGFMTAVGLLVFDAQLPRLLGLPSDIRLLTDIRDPAVLTAIDPMALAVGVVVIALFVGLPRIHKSIPAPLVAVAVAIFTVMGLGLDVHMVDHIEAGFPSPALPPFARVDIGALFPEALALAMLASIDSLLCAVAVESRTPGERTRTDQELVAQGLANLASACFGGMPVAAAVVRSIAAVEAGATTRVAPLAQSLLLGGVVLVLAPLAMHVPLVALAGVLVVVGMRLVDFRTIIAMWRIARFEALVFAVTTLGILLTDFVLGVGIGIVAALVHFARQQRTSVETFERTDTRSRPSLLTDETHTIGLRFEGPLFFGSQVEIEDAIREATDGHHVVIDVSQVTTIDVSGAMALAKALRRIAADGTTVSMRSGQRALEPVLRYIIDGCRAEGLDIEHDEGSRRSVIGPRGSIPPKERSLRLDADATHPT